MARPGRGTEQLERRKENSKALLRDSGDVAREASSEEECLAQTTFPRTGALSSRARKEATIGSMCGDSTILGHLESDPGDAC